MGRAEKKPFGLDDEFGGEFARAPRRTFPQGVVWVGLALLLILLTLGSAWTTARPHPADAAPTRAEEPVPAAVDAEPKAAPDPLFPPGTPRR